MAHYKGAASEAGRALQLKMKREQAKEDLEMRKKKIEEETKLSSIGNKFAAHYDAIEAQLKSSTIGLVTLDEMKAKQEDFIKERERQLAQRTEQQMLREIEEKRKQKEQQRKQIQTLSFRFDEGEDEEEDEEDGSDKDKDEDVKVKVEVKQEADEGETIKVKVEPKDEDEEEREEKDDKEDVISDQIKVKEEADSDSNTRDSLVAPEETSNDGCTQPMKKRRIVKNPDVDTSFLPDREREEQERTLREVLRQEWVEKQEKLKGEEIEITFSYWDGSGHRRSVKMKKGNTMYQFLHKALELLRKEFHELRAVSADQLMYVKEDLIIPHHYSFYDFIVTKARGKSGPLFSFDVHDDIRMMADATREKDESHAGKVLLRSWYERNKHIFPASRWEPYDPTKSYGKYMISDKKSK